MEYMKLIGHCTDCSLVSLKKKLGQEKKKKQKISITFTAAAEGEQNQWKEHTY